MAIRWSYPQFSVEIFYKLVCMITLSTYLANLCVMFITDTLILHYLYIAKTTTPNSRLTIANVSVKRGGNWNVQEILSDLI